VVEEGGKRRSVEEMKSELEGLHNTVAESWIFSCTSTSFPLLSLLTTLTFPPSPTAMDFSLLSTHSGFAKIPSFMHAKPNRAILVPRTGMDPKRPNDPSAFSKPHMPSCRLETTCVSFLSPFAG
jgi:hypothetical protein